MKCQELQFKFLINLWIIINKKLEGKVKKYSGSLDAFIKIFKAHGIKGSYRGIFPTILREGPGSSKSLS